MNNLVTVVGPTASGKTRLSLEIALACNGEIIGADSRQIYCDVNIAVDKPSAEERALVPHHLIDFVRPDSDFTLAQYKEAALAVIADIQMRGKVPLLAGGTGLYIWSIIEGWDIPHIPPDIKTRHKLEARAEKEGATVLYTELCGVDPEGANRINPNNLRRIIRALEVYYATGQPFSRFLSKSAPDFNNLIIGLTLAREDLYRRIDARVDEMVKRGLVEETRFLLDKGYRLDSPAMTGLGYKHIVMYLRGEISLPEAVQKIKYDTHHFARRQYAWFHLDDPRIHRFDIKCDGFEKECICLVQDFLSVS